MKHISPSNLLIESVQLSTFLYEGLICDTPHHSLAVLTLNNGSAITFDQEYPLATHIINQRSTGQNLDDF